MKERLNYLITEIKEVCKNTNLNVSDNTILEQAMTNWRGEQMSKNKFHSQTSNEVSESKVVKKEVNGENQSESPQKTFKFVPATKKQLFYIHKNNLDVNTEKLSKFEASKLISKHKEGDNEI